MALQKSQTQDIQTIVGNGLAIYQDGTTGLLMLKDVNGKTISLQDFFQGDQDNIGRIIEVESSELPSEGSPIKERVSEYVNDLEYEKLATDAEVWVNINEGLTSFTLSLETSDGCGLIPETLTGIIRYHNGIGELPVVGDTIFTDANGTTPLANVVQAEARVVMLGGVGQYFIATDADGVSVSIVCK